MSDDGEQFITLCMVVNAGVFTMVLWADECMEGEEADFQRVKPLPKSWQSNTNNCQPEFMRSNGSSNQAFADTFHCFMSSSIAYQPFAFVSRSANMDIKENTNSLMLSAPPLELMQ